MTREEVIKLILSAGKDGICSDLRGEIALRNFSIDLPFAINRNEAIEIYRHRFMIQGSMNEKSIAGYKKLLDDLDRSEEVEVFIASLYTYQNGYMIFLSNEKNEIINCLKNTSSSLNLRMKSHDLAIKSGFESTMKVFPSMDYNLPPND